MDVRKHFGLAHRETAKRSARRRTGVEQQIGGPMQCHHGPDGCEAACRLFEPKRGDHVSHESCTLLIVVRSGLLARVIGANGIHKPSMTGSSRKNPDQNAQSQQEDHRSRQQVFSMKIEPVTAKLAETAAKKVPSAVVRRHGHAMAIERPSGWE